VSLDEADMRKLRQLLDDVIHAAHVADEPARDWAAWACDTLGVASLVDLDAEQAVRLVHRLQIERSRLHATTGREEAQ
jgi:hypothetical protein